MGLQKKIDILELLLLMAKGWWLLLFFTTAFMLLSLFITDHLVKPIYEGEAILFIGKSESDKMPSLDDLNLQSRLLMDYAQLIQTRLIAQETIDRFGLNVTVDEFKDRLAVYMEEDSRFITLNYMDGDPSRAVEVTNYLAELLVSKGIEVMGINEISLVDKAVIQHTPVNISKQVNLAAGAMTGLLISILSILIRYKLDRRIKKENDLLQLGVYVLGNIPKHSSFKEAGL